MNRRNFLMGSAAALVAAPVVVPPLTKDFNTGLMRTMWPEEAARAGWHIIGYDPAGKDNGMVLYARIHDEMIYVDSTVDFTADEIRYRWRVAAPEIAKWWGTHGT